MYINVSLCKILGLPQKMDPPLPKYKHFSLIPKAKRECCYCHQVGHVECLPLKYNQLTVGKLCTDDE